MIKKIKTHHITIPIFLVFCIAIIGLIFGYQSNSQIILDLSVIAIFFYMIFAFTHHHFDKTFNVEIILEYILIAVLALVVIVGTMYY